MMDPEVRMRKVLAGVFSVFVVIPLLSGALFLAGVRSWVLDPAFYSSAAGDERLYDGWEEGASRFLAAAEADDGLALDVVAARAGLSAAFTSRDLAGIASRFAEEAVNGIRTSTAGSVVSLDLRPIKTELNAAIDPFIRAYVKAYSGPASPSSGNARGKLADRIRAIPDEVPLGRTPAEAGQAFPVFLRGRTVAQALDRSVFAFLAVACLAAFAAAMASSSLWIERAKWFGGLFVAPSVLLIASGAIAWIGASGISGAGSGLIAERLAALVGELWRSAGPDAVRIASVLAEAVQRVGKSFFLTGLAAAGVSAVFSAARFAQLPEDDERSLPEL